MTNRSIAIALVLLSISAATLKAEERVVDAGNITSSGAAGLGKTHFSSNPGYTVFPEPHIQPGIGEGFGMIGGIMNVDDKNAAAYSILYSGRVKGMAIGIADLHITSNSAGEESSDTFYGSVGWHQERATSYQAIVSYRGAGSQENPFLTAKTYSAGITASETGAHERELSYGYTVTRRDNTERQGNDYAYVSHRLNAMINGALNGKWSYYLRTNANLFLYSNPDSYAQYEKKRVNYSISLGGGVTYHYNKELSLFAGYDFYTQHSNLTRGFAYNQLHIIEGIQSASLGSYNSNSANIGIRYNF